MNGPEISLELLQAAWMTRPGFNPRWIFSRAMRNRGIEWMPLCRSMSNIRRCDSCDN